MRSTMETEEINNIIKQLKSNGIDFERLPLITTAIIDHYTGNESPDLDTMLLADLLLSMLNYCLGEKLTEHAQFEKLFKCVSDLLCSLALQDSKNFGENLKSAIEKILCNLTLNIVSGKNEDSPIALKYFDLSSQKISNSVKIVLVKVMTKMIAIINTIKWNLCAELNGILLNMLLISNDLLSRAEYNANTSCITILSKDDLIHLYSTIVLYFHRSSQDWITFKYLNAELLKSKNITIEVKFLIVTLLWDHLSTFSSFIEEIMEANKPRDKPCLERLQFTEKTSVVGESDSANYFIVTFFTSLKSICLDELCNINLHIRKSALFILQSLYLMNSNVAKDVTWETFFNVFETLEESQVNLILPVIVTVDACECLHLRRILLARVFQNENANVVKEGIKQLHVLNDDLPTLVTLLPMLMKALNNLGLYYPESESVERSIVHLFELLNKPYVNEENYIVLIDAIIGVSWGPVPLFYISKYLKLASTGLISQVILKDHLPRTISLLKTVTKLLHLNLKHNRIIRSGIDFCLKEHMRITIIEPLEHSSLDVDDWDSIQNLNNILNTVAFDTDTFNLLLKVLSRSLSYNYDFVSAFLDKHFFSNNEIQASSFHVTALLLHARKILPASLISSLKGRSGIISQSLENMSTLIKFCEKYTSVPDELWCHIISSTPDNGCCFMHFFLAELYTEEQFKAHLTEVLNQDLLDRYDRDLEFLITHGKSVRDFVRNQLLHASIDFSQGHFGYFQTEYNYLYVLNLLQNGYKFDEDFAQRYENQLRFLLDKDVFFKSENRKSVELKLKMILRLCHSAARDGILLDLFILSGLCNDCLSHVNRDVLPVVLEIMEMLMPSCLKDRYALKKREINEIYIPFVRESFLEVQNSKKTSSFRKNMSGWVFSIFPVLNIADFHQVILECVDSFVDHEESSYTFFKRLGRNLRDSMRKDISEPYQEFLIHLLMKGLVYGDLPKKDILAEQEVCQFIRKEKMGKLWHLHFNYSVRIRYKCLYIMHAVCRKEEKAIKLLENMKEVFDSKQARVQYFNNSLTHRTKLRALQAVLILDHLIENVRVKQELLEWSLEGLINHNHQPSIRYCLELLVIRNLEALDHCEQFWSRFDKAYDERPGSIVSFLCIMFHVIQRILTCSDSKTKKQVQLTDEAFERIHLCSMSQLFNLRLYANVIFMKLFVLMGPDWTELIQKFQMIYNAMSRTKESAKGNAILNADKLKSDFYFNSYHPFTQFTLETIFYDLPRLSGVAPDEWQHWREILDSDFFIVECLWNSKLPVLNNESCGLLHEMSPEWIMRSSAKDSDDASLTYPVPTTSSISVSQKKFIPCAPECGSQLIVVTSLIDKIPNIGGLSRSCEVFGATLVVDSLEVVRDAEFKALSMTSEKHANIVEVKKHNLKTYLIHMRRDEGYRIIGAEQTNNSVNLQDFQYPKKSILVLGNEKDGIRSDILALLDSYVEIPQLGVLRSLNVHVTGALFLWEYVKQHRLNSPPS